MKLSFRAVFLFACLALTSGLSRPVLVFAQPRAFQSAPEALALIEKANQLRTAKNLPPYQINEILMRVAQSHAEHIAQTGFLSRYERGLAPYQRALEAGYPVAGNLSQGGLYAENLHSGLNASADDAIEKWSGDSQYFRALYSEDFEDVGAGVASAGGVTYFVLDAGAALDDPAFWRTPTPTSDGLVVASTPLEDGKIYHIVQAQEYLWNIALAYNVTVEEIKKLNRLSDDNVYEGQKLLIYQPPPGPTLSPTPGITPTATFGVPTSTATQPATPTPTFTFTPAPPPPVPVPALPGAEKTVGAIVLISMFAAALGAWLGRKK